MNTDSVWRIFQDANSTYWIGICDTLKLTLEGKTRRELLENIADGLDLLEEQTLLR
jgi:predicted RNase H-like HicB family nuclease